MRSGTVFDTAVSLVKRVGVKVDGLIDALACIVNKVVPDIGVSADADANMSVSVIIFLEPIMVME